MIIRDASPQDAPAVAAIYGPIVRDTAISFETEPPTPDEMARRVAATLPDFPWLAAEEDGAFLGYAYAGAHRPTASYRWSANVSIYLAETARGRGVGKALYRDLLARLRRQGICSVFAGIALPNSASVALHESVGFAPVGVYRRVGYKLGAWRDVGWWGQSLVDDDSPPPEFIPYRDLRQ
ncbi:phosphinothricin acetyltransferase [Caulobacter ginsengisoli]|uniref:Phosphinothricin acetyltransferase n=1 Tax=Caulobacter ginsengisoli TaxID=400775 RepID=A0ABU0IVV7_9CAUL|nr:arsinothricin resistance N-acetyltransferase ArsN1 family B [Caulobacter ginsengisoli]MDQ0466151.1 phosphinothricin acetyltransferase [Caulobacter ginsengisoli]